MCVQAGKTPLDIALEKQQPAAASLLAEALAGRGVGSNTPTGQGSANKGGLEGEQEVRRKTQAGRLVGIMQEATPTS